MELIDKSALVAEIERLIKSPILYKSENVETRINVLEYLLSFLDNLEVKEVDLDKLIDDYMLPITAQDVKEEPFTQLEKCAKHFFELGLKFKNKIE